MKKKGMLLCLLSLMMVGACAYADTPSTSSQSSQMVSQSETTDSSKETQSVVASESLQVSVSVVESFTADSSSSEESSIYSESSMEESSFEEESAQESDSSVEESSSEEGSDSDSESSSVESSSSESSSVESSSSESSSVEDSEEEKEVYCTVYFDTDGGSAVASLTVLAGEKISQPKTPSKETKDYKYIFLGWYYEGELWDFENGVVTQNMTLVAMWKEGEHYTNPFLPKD